jgi:Zn-dependent protease with chaperone function
MLHAILILAYAGPFIAGAMFALPEGGQGASGAGVHASSVGPLGVVWLVPWLVATAAWGVSHAASVRGERVASKVGSLRAIEASETMMRLAWLCTLLAVLGACGLSRGQLPAGVAEVVRELPAWSRVLATSLAWMCLSLLPVLACVVGTLLSFARCDNRVHEALLTRSLDEGRPFVPPLGAWGFAWSRLRRHASLTLVPVVCIVVVGGVLAALPSSVFEPVVMVVREGAHALTGVLARLSSSAHAHGAGGVQAPPATVSSASVREAAEGVLAVLAIFAIAPHALTRVFGARRLGAGELRSRIEAVLATHKVRALGPCVLPSRDGEVNAMVVGAAWPSRYLLLTAPLLERLTKPQLEAVVAHEVAHLRLRHMPWLLVTALGAMLTGAWAGVGLARAGVALGLAAGSSTMVELASAMATGLAVVLGLAFGLWAFGAASRRFEWQADAFAVRHLARQELAQTQLAHDSLMTANAAHTVRDMLQAVADANNFSTARPDFRHGSIEQRQAKVLSLVGLPSRTLPIDRVVVLIKLVSLLALVLAGGAMLLG